MARKPEERAFSFLKVNERQAKPRTRGLTEIRGPYSPLVGKRYLEEVRETVGHAIAASKFGGGPFSVIPRRAVKELIDLCHAHQVSVSTGGFVEYVLTQGPEAVRRYLQACKDLGFDTVEISAGFITLPADDVLRLVEQVQKLGMRAKPEVGIVFGRGGGTAAAELEAEGTRDPGPALALARRCLDAGAPLVMIESEGITENVRAWRTDVVARVVDALGPGRVMFEAAD